MKGTKELKTLQKEQTDIEQEIKTLQRRQEDFFQLQKKETHIYNWLVDTSTTDEQHFFKDRAENSLFLARKAQTQLKEEEEHAIKRKKDLQEQEVEIQHLIREKRNNGEEEN